MIERPVFFVGMGRSGTTILFEAFAIHPDLGWVSNYLAKFPRWPALNGLHRLFDNRMWQVRGRKAQGDRLPWWNRLAPRPQEGYPFWREYCGDQFLWSYLLGVDADPAKAHRLREVLGRALAWQGKKRFTAKLTGPPRIHYLRTIFPDAIFIHVVRDGRAVVHSLLNVEFWRQKGGTDSEFWDGAFTVEMRSEWERHDRSPVALAALQWVRELEVARAEQAELAAGQFIEVRYEDFLAEPHSVLRRLYLGSGLSYVDATEAFINAQNLFLAANLKYRQMSVVDIEVMQSIMEPELQRYGYLV